MPADATREPNSAQEGHERRQEMPSPFAKAVLPPIMGCLFSVWVYVSCGFDESKDSSSQLEELVNRAPVQKWDMDSR
jgi:hypothetical protein